MTRLRGRGLIVDKDLLLIKVNFMTFQSNFCNICFRIYSLPYEQEFINSILQKYYGIIVKLTFINNANTIIGLPIPGPRGPGGQIKTWSTCVKDDLRVMGVRNDVGALDLKKRRDWRDSVRRCQTAA